MPRPALTLPEILAWADEHKARRGKWPKAADGPIKAGPLGTTWRQVENALRIGLRGLPGGSSDAKLLAEHRGYRNIHGLPPLTEKQILAWADAHLQRTGEWPTECSGPVAETAGETWENINAAMRVGNRGLPGGDTLAMLLARGRNVTTKAAVPPLTESLILEWIDEHRQVTGEWPAKDSGPIVGKPGETWLAVNAALRSGGRGLSGNSSLAQFLAKHRGVRHQGQLPKLSRKTILAWAQAHFEQTGQWPTPESGCIGAAPEETWKAVDLALHHGLRGLPGGSSLHAMLVQYLGKPGQHNSHVKELSSRERGRPRNIGRRKKAMRMRQQGLTFVEIGRRLGITRQGASHLVQGRAKGKAAN